MISFNRGLPFSALVNTVNELTSSILRNPFPDGFANAAIYISSELAANIKDHARAEKCAIELKITNKIFSLCFRDDGIGIRNSYLRNNIFAKDDRSSIELAVGGLSTKKLNERAFGLFSIRKIAGKLSGSLNIRSGKASMTFKKNKISFTFLKKSIAGVQVTVIVKVQKVNIYNYIS